MRMISLVFNGLDIRRVSKSLEGQFLRINSSLGIDNTTTRLECFLAYFRSTELGVILEFDSFVI